MWPQMTKWSRQNVNSLKFKRGNRHSFTDYNQSLTGITLQFCKFCKQPLWGKMES